MKVTALLTFRKWLIAKLGLDAKEELPNDDDNDALRLNGTLAKSVKQIVVFLFVI